MFNLIAHAGEDHADIIESTSHILPWYLEVSLFVGLMILFTLIVYKISKKLSTTILISSAVLLITGVGFYSYAPAISALAITVGLTTTLAVTLLGLGSSGK